MLEFQVKSTGDESCTNEREELPSSVERSLHTQPSNDQLMLILRKLPKAGRKKNYSKGLERTVKVLTQGWEKYLFRQTNGKTHKSWGTKQSIRKVLPEQWGLISIRPTTAPELLNKNHKNKTRKVQIISK